MVSLIWRKLHDDRVRLHTLSEEGMSVNELSQRFNVDRRTVQRFLRKVEEHGNIDDRPRSGRPRRSSERQDRQLIRLSSGNPRLVSRELNRQWNALTGIETSSSTVRRRLSASGLHGRIAAKKPMLTRAQKAARLMWARERIEWTVENWTQVLLSDECPIHLVQVNQRRYVRRRGNSCLNDGFTRPSLHSGGGKIMVWGGFSLIGLQALRRIPTCVNTEAYLDVLTEEVLPLDLPCWEVTFQQDNAPAHTSQRTLRFLEENHISPMDWPSQSPDLNPIEHIWSHIKHRLDQRVINTMDELWEATQAEWQALTLEFLETLVESMPRRLQAVIRAHGGAIDY